VSEILAEAVLVSTAGLIALPLVTRRFRRSFRRSEHARFDAAAIGGGLVLLEVALVACALPAVASALGIEVSDRHFFPGEDVIGWISAVAATALAASVIFGYQRFRRADARLLVEPSIGCHEDRGWFELVTLDSALLLAYAHDGEHRQVVITSGLVSLLTLSELRAVIDHELGHLRQGHQRFLGLAAALDPAARIVPLLGRIIDNLRLSIEFCADDAVRDRAAARRALIRLSFPGPPQPAAAFAAADIAERVEALGELPRSGSSGVPRRLLYTTAGTFVAVSLAALLVYWF
jgi:hypothetical protein